MRKVANSLQLNGIDDRCIPILTLKVLQMKQRTNSGHLVAVLVSGILAIGSLGCSPPPADDSAVTANTGHAHDHPESLGEAIEMLAEQCETIKTAFDAGTPDDAHGVLHDVGHTLTSAAELATDLPEEEKEPFATALDSLTSCFGELDGLLHGIGSSDKEGEEPDLSPTLDKITEAMKTLTELATK